MKTFRVAVSVAVVLTFICIQFTEERTLEEPASKEVNTAAEETSEDQLKVRNHLNRRFKCRICCNCCLPGYCGLCCKF
uniref:Hepcidin n=1 Tax=Salarias fasciatus TaxID=181472 RepID=A0A672HTI8_SALFA